MTALAFGAGVVFALGLYLAGVTAPSVVLDAFRFDAAWDPRLWLMFAGAQLVALPAAVALARRGRTLRGLPLPPPPARLSALGIDARLVTGSLVFGVGWGVAGMCPGPTFASVGGGGVHAALALVGLLAGIAFHDAREASHPGA